MNTNDNQHSVYIENLGCAKNQVDAETLLALLAGAGWTVVEEASLANLIIVNTCGFLESAREESINTFFALHEAHPQAKIVVAGCLAQRYGNELEKELPESDGIFGNMNLSKITSFAEELLKGDRAFSYPEIALEPEVERFWRYNYPASAYLKLSEGCNHRCSYCAIPLIRGDLRSRSEQAILNDAAFLIREGVKEINLVAQDLAAYGTDSGEPSQFTKLLRKLCSLEGEFAVRLLYIHPDAFPEDLIDLMLEEPKIIRYFDIPFQHAATPILRSMGRLGTKESYLTLIDSIRAKLPDAVIRTTMMLGYPAERDVDFEEVLDFLSKARFDWVGSFVYSLENDTPAERLTTKKEHKAMQKVAQIRQNRLNDMQQQITMQQLQRFVGTTCEVLIEEQIQGEDLSIGRMYAQAPEVDGLTVVMGRDLVPGSVITCGITRVNGIDLEAVPCKG